MPKLIRAPTLTAILLLCLLPLMLPQQCQDPSTPAAHLVRQVWVNNGADQTQIFTSYVGDSTDIYYGIWIWHSSPISQECVVVRERADGTQVWAKKYLPVLWVQSLVENPSESYVYVLWAEITYSRIVRINSADGTVDTIKQNDHQSVASHYANGQVVSDGSGGDYLLVGGFDPANDEANVCKISIDSNTVECMNLPDLYQYTRKMMVTQSNKVLVTGVNLASPTEYKVKYFDFGTVTPEWGFKMACPSASCSSDYSMAVENATEGSVTVFASFGPNKDLVVMTLAQATGNLLRDKVHFPDCEMHSKAMVHDDYFFIIAECFGKKNVIQIDPSTLSVVDFAQRNEGNTITLFFHPSSQEIVVGGHTNSPYSAYKVSAPFGSLKYLPSFENTNTVTPTVLTSADTQYALVPDSTPLAAVVPNSLTPYSTPAGFEVTATFAPNTSWDLDAKISFNLSTEEFKVTLGQSRPLPVTLSCVNDTTSTVSFALNSYDSYSLPDFVELDSANKVLVNNPGEEGDFYFSIDTTATGWTGPRQKIIKLVVGNCKQENCSTCSVSNFNFCEECMESFEKQDNGTCQAEVTIETIPGAVLTSQIITGGAVAFAVLSSFLNLSSPVVLWMVVSHLQMLMLLLLTGAEVPDEVGDMLTSSSYMMMPLSFISISPLADKMFGGNSQSNQALRQVGVEYSTTLRNSFGLMQSLVGLGLLHLVTLAFSGVKSHPNSRWYRRFIVWVVQHVFSALTFAAYIRTIFESVIFILVCCLSEIMHPSFENNTEVVSFCLAVVFFASLVCANLIVFLHYRNFRSSTEEASKKIGELYSGLKVCPYARAYSAVWMLRRILFVTIIITLDFLPPEPKILLKIPIQILYLIFLGYARPFVQLKANLIELTNEGVLLGLLCYLTWFNDQEKWTEKTTSIFTFTLMANNVIVVLIIAIAFAIELSIKIKKWCKKKPEVAPRQAEPVNPTHQLPRQSQVQEESNFDPSAVSGLAMRSDLKIEEVKS